MFLFIAVIVTAGLTISDDSFCVLIDKNGDGNISKQELGDLLKDIGHPLPGFRLRELIQKLDTDNDEKLNFNEFTSVRSKQSRKASTCHKCVQAYCRNVKVIN